MRVESFATATARWCRRRSGPRVQTGRLITTMGSGLATPERWRRRSCRLPMGESAAAEAATSERDVLLATKLNVPGLRPDLVPRPRLAQRLDEGRATRTGPGLRAGRVRQDCAAGRVGPARSSIQWPGCRLDAGDNDPARFWRHMVAALDRVRPGISERMAPLLGPPAPPSFEPLVTALINEVADQPDADEALLLVLDDYHVISSQLVHESLGFLLEHRPPGLHRGVDQPQRPAAGPGAAAGPRPADRGARRGTALHARGGGGAAAAGRGRARRSAARYAVA